MGIQVCVVPLAMVIMEENHPEIHTKITGQLNCDKIKNKMYKTWLFIYF